MDSGQPQNTETTVKTYKSAKDFEKDAKHMAKQDWSPSNIMNHQPDRSIVGKLLMPGGVFTKPGEEIVVTYQLMVRSFLRGF